jgi:hypothetical protein
MSESMLAVSSEPSAREGSHNRGKQALCVCLVWCMWCRVFVVDIEGLLSASFGSERPHVRANLHITPYNTTYIHSAFPPTQPDVKLTSISTMVHQFHLH